MEQLKVISGGTIDDVWSKIDADFAAQEDLFEYSALIDQQGVSVAFDMEIDLGGGFEGGYRLTRFVSKLQNLDEFRFSIHRQDLMDGVGKFFGLQDIKLGYPDFDKVMLIKTNNSDRLRDILSDSTVRDVLLSLPDFTFHIGHHHAPNTFVESGYLELRIDEAITETSELRAIYASFVHVLSKLEIAGGSIMNYL
jgi:hypothetical protein